MTLPLSPPSLPQWAVDRRLAACTFFHIPEPDLVGRDGRGTTADLRAIVAFVAAVVEPPPGEEPLTGGQVAVLIGRHGTRFYDDCIARVCGRQALMERALTVMKAHGWRVRAEVLAAQTVMPPAQAVGRARWAGVFAKECGA